MHKLAALVVLTGLIASNSFAGTDNLSGTSWQLISIKSMNDKVKVPAASARYILGFQSGHSVSILADCNRATGSWTANDSNGIRFGEIAATQAICPPPSLSQDFLDQLTWVRSYVLKDGHLYLATMADGSIIEFEPIGEVVATLFGKEIRLLDKQQTQSAILEQIFDRYAAEKGIVTTPEEIEAFVETMRKGMASEGLTAEKDLNEEEAAQVKAMRSNLAKSIIRQWKINKSLHDAYGGRIIYQQFGPEPLDAYRTYLRDLETAGNLLIRDEEVAAQFWEYFTDDAKHDFMPKGSEDEKRAFSIPPWE